MSREKPGRPEFGAGESTAKGDWQRQRDDCHRRLRSAEERAVRLEQEKRQLEQLLRQRTEDLGREIRQLRLRLDRSDSPGLRGVPSETGQGPMAATQSPGNGHAVAPSEPLSPQGPLSTQGDVGKNTDAFLGILRLGRKEERARRRRLKRRRLYLAVLLLVLGLAAVVGWQSWKEYPGRTRPNGTGPTGTVPASMLHDWNDDRG